MRTGHCTTSSRYPSPRPPIAESQEREERRKDGGDEDDGEEERPNYQPLSEMGLYTHTLEASTRLS